MKTIGKFIKKEIIFTVSALLAVATMIAVPPTIQYVNYIDFSVLGILFSLMATVGGLQKSGAFDLLSGKLLCIGRSSRGVSLILVCLCFFTSMLITNDVALSTFVPLTIYLSENKDSNAFIYVIVLETIAANLGSLVTPIGNPQNLFLFHYYGLQVGEFLQITIPLGITGFVLIVCAAFFSGKTKWKDGAGVSFRGSHRGGVLKYGILFLICILTVFQVINPGFCVLITVGMLLATDRGVLRMVDYLLLLTFLNFFIIVGNLAQLDQIKELIGTAIQGQVLLWGVATSQIISNVPAAVLLAPFTGAFRELILGVNIGGLGTLVASMASIISFKYYSMIEKAKNGRYLLIFTGMNLVYLGVFLLIFLK